MSVTRTAMLPDGRQLLQLAAVTLWGRWAMQVVLVACGGLCGVAWGWQGETAWIGLSALVPLFWSAARDRWTAGAVALAFYLSASRGLPIGTGIFFASTAPAWFGWALWIAVGVVNAAAWVVFWHARRVGRALAAPLIVLLTAIPPIGFIGWSNPLTAAGVLYPGLGFVGLGMLCALWMAWLNQRRMVVVVLGMIALVANVVRPAMSIERPGWEGVDTHYGKLASGSDDFSASFERVEGVAQLADAVPANQVAVLPETVLGLYTSATEGLLASVSRELAARHSAVIVGAELLGKPGTLHLENALVVLGDSRAKPMLERVPVPIGMWRPWSRRTFDAYPFGSGVATVRGHRVAYAICYEQLLVYPLLVSFAHRPDVMVGAANDWWAKGTSIPVIQGQVLDTWGRLFAVPVVRAMNA